MKVLNCMSSFIPLPAIIQRILQVRPASLLPLPALTATVAVAAAHCTD